jgi:hypothetical protein
MINRVKPGIRNENARGIFNIRSGLPSRNVPGICAMLNTDLMLGVPGEDENILAHLQSHEIISRELAG